MPDTPDIWEIIESRELVDCRVFKVHENLSRSGDHEGSFFVIENPDWVNVIAETIDGEIVLIEQFRHGSSNVTLEIPGGMVDAGEDPVAAARRELEEETGFTAADFKLLGRTRPNPALQSNWIYHFLARDAKRTSATNFDADESVTTRLVGADTIVDLVIGGEITHSLVLAAFHLYKITEDKKLCRLN